MLEQYFYTVRVTKKGFRVTKFDSNYNVLVTYEPVTLRSCTCPNGENSRCKHRSILREFLREGKVDSGWFYCYENGYWDRPLNDPIRLFRKLMERNHA